MKEVFKVCLKSKKKNVIRNGISHARSVSSEIKENNATLNALTKVRDDLKLSLI